MTIRSDPAAAADPAGDAASALAREDLMSILDGLLAVNLLRFRAQPLELARARAEADATADVLAEQGDRLTAPGNFSGAEERAKRGQALSAIARALALGALQDGGVTWAGRHWCTTTHPDCPNRRN